VSKIPFASGPFKTCSTCKRDISQAEWAKLPSIGHQVIPPYPPENDPGEVLGLKNCGCGSTLALAEPFTAAELEVVVAELQRADPALSLKRARQLAIERLKWQG
jgi:hypothetical protein